MSNFYSVARSHLITLLSQAAR